MPHSATLHPFRIGTAPACYADVQEQASALKGWNQEYLQLSAGRFSGQLSDVSGNGIKLFVEDLGQSVYQRGLLPEGVLAIGMPLQSSGVGVFCGRYCDADTFHVFSGRSGFEFRSSRQHTMLGLELDLASLGLHASDAVATSLPSAGVLALPPAVHAELKDYLLALYQSAVQEPGLLSEPAVVATVAEYVLDRMGAHNDGGKPDAACVDTHWKLVQHSVALVKDVAEKAPTVSELCKQLGVSRRTLQNAFARVLGVSPLAYVKAQRLNQARSKLKAAASVTEAATACGFWHFGHFAQDYHAMFGEHPSETLRAQPRKLAS